jgi:tRNA threonylcarbamoyladenosine biosynthesis protein TsaB
VTLLSFDTSGEVLSIYVESAGGSRETVIDSGLRHAEYLMPEISRLLEENNLKPEDLDLIAVSRGPGSFTGLRIGMATAKGIAAGSNVPMISIPTLDAMAWGRGWSNALIVPIIDARKGRFYSCLYQNNNPLTEYLDTSADDLLQIIEAKRRDEQTPVQLTGPGSMLFSRKVSLPGFFHFDPFCRRGLAFALARCACSNYTGRDKGDKPEDGPLYIRKSEAELSLSGRSTQ